MKNILVIFVFALLCSCQEKRQPGSDSNKAGNESCAQNRNIIQVGVVDSIYSTILKENRKIWIYLPNRFNNSIFTGQQQYPVAYLLDGDVHFHSFTGIIDQLSEQNGNMICPDMIVVGILDTNRSRDYTPTTDSFEERESGGAEKFTAFIEQELIPHIDSQYHPAPFRMLIGHSYGGLMVINTLLHHAEPFNAFVAIDPSLSWDNQKLLHQADSLLKKNNFRDKYLYMAIANTMSVDMNLDQIKRDTSEESLHIRSNLAFIDELQKKSLTTLRWDYDYYEDEDHVSVPLRAEYDALHFVFRYHPFTAYAALFDPAINADSARSLILTHFQYESRLLGYSITPPEKFMNDIGYSAMYSGYLKKALTFFQMNIGFYPLSANVYDSMGDYYTFTNDKATAVQCYKKSLAIKNLPLTKEKIEALSK